MLTVESIEEDAARPHAGFWADSPLPHHPASAG